MSKKNVNNDLVTNTFNEFQFYSPKEKQSLGKFIYNSKNGTYLGRTAASWGKCNARNSDGRIQMRGKMG